MIEGCIVAAADTNGDGTAELVLQSISNGYKAVWFMAADDITLARGTLLNPDTVATSWRIAATYDANGNGGVQNFIGRTAPPANLNCGALPLMALPVKVFQA